MAEHPREQVWLGTLPFECNICKGRLKGEFVDGKTFAGPWAVMCAPCHANYGYGVGTGLGQRYKKKEDGRYWKVEG